MKQNCFINNFIHSKKKKQEEERKQQLYSAKKGKRANIKAKKRHHGFKLGKLNRNIKKDAELKTIQSDRHHFERDRWEEERWAELWW